MPIRRNTTRDAILKVAYRFTTRALRVYGSLDLMCYALLAIVGSAHILDLSSSSNFCSLSLLADFIGHPTPKPSSSLGLGIT